MEYSEEYVEQLENVIDSLRAELREQKEINAALSKERTAFAEENKLLCERIEEYERANRPDRAQAFKNTLTTFFDLTNSEMTALAPVISHAPSPAKDFDITDGVLNKYVGMGRDVVIPDSVTSIGDYAFSGCYKLTVKCPAGSYAEQYCMNHYIKYVNGKY